MPLSQVLGGNTSRGPAQGTVAASRRSAGRVTHRWRRKVAGEPATGP